MITAKNMKKRITVVVALMVIAATTLLWLSPREPNKSQPQPVALPHGMESMEEWENRTEKNNMPNPQITAGGDPVEVTSTGSTPPADVSTNFTYDIINSSSTIVASGVMATSDTDGGFTSEILSPGTFNISADNTVTPDTYTLRYHDIGTSYFSLDFDVVAGSPPDPWPTEGGLYGSCTRLKAGDVINFEATGGTPLGSYTSPREQIAAPYWQLYLNGSYYYAATIPVGWDYTEVDSTHWQLTVPSGVNSYDNAILTTYLPAPYPVGAYASYVGCFYISDDYSLNPPTPGTLQHYIDGSQHYFRATSPATLPTGATKFKLKARTATAVTLSSEVDVSTQAFVAPDNNLVPAIISWVAVDSSDIISESDPVLADLLASDFSGISTAALGTAGFLTVQPNPLGLDSVLSPSSVLIEVPANITDTPFQRIEFVYFPHDEASPAHLRDIVNPSDGNYGTGSSSDVDAEWYHVFNTPYAWISDPLNRALRLAIRYPNAHGATYSAAVTLSITAPPLPPQNPIVTITGATTATVSAVTFDDSWDHLEFRYYLVSTPGTVLTAAMVDATAKNLTGLIAGQPYLGFFRAYDADGGYVDSGTTPFTPNADGDTTTTQAPSIPGELVALEIQDVYAIVDLPSLPANADSLRIMLDTGGTLTPAAAVVVDGSTRKILNLTANTAYVFRAQAVNTFGVTNGPPLDLKTRATASTGSVPNKPNPPFATSLAPVKISTSGWQSGVTSTELYKNGTLVATFNSSSDTYTDPTATTGDAYTVKAHNSIGDSVASDPFTLNIASTKLALTWQTPAASATLAGKQLLSFSASASLINPRILIRGLEAGTPTFNESNSHYELTVDTRDYANGAVVLTATATGSDGLPATATRSVTITNTLASGVRYNIIKWLSAPADGEAWSQALLSLENIALSGIQRKWRWVLSAVTKALPATQLIGGSATDSEKATAFQTLQKVVMERAQVGTTPDRVQLRSSVQMAPAGDKVYWVQQWTPAQFLSHYLTGCEQVIKFREIESGKWLVFANSPTGTDAAKAFIFDGETLSLLVDLNDHGATDATDVALLADKLFVVGPDELFAVDTDSGEATLNLSPRGETRAATFVENIGGKMLAVFVDAELEEAATRCYDLTFTTPKLLWALDDATGVSWTDGTTWLLGAGPKLFEVVNNAPTLKQTFSANITALMNNYVGLESGSLWRLQDTTKYLAFASHDTTAKVFVSDLNEVLELIVDSGLTDGDASDANAVAASQLDVSGSAVSSVSLTDEAALVTTIQGKITALGGAYADLTISAVFRLQSDMWERLFVGSDAIQAVGAWEGSGDEMLGVAGTDSPNLLEEGTNGLWTDARVIEPSSGMTETISSITALARYEKVLKAAQGTPGQPDFVPAEIIVKLLIGTGPDGVLSVLELSSLNEGNGAFLSSGTKYPHISPYASRATA